MSNDIEPNELFNESKDPGRLWQDVLDMASEWYGAKDIIPESVYNTLYKDTDKLYMRLSSIRNSKSIHVVLTDDHPVMAFSNLIDEAMLYGFNIQDTLNQSMHPKAVSHWADHLWKDREDNVNKTFYKSDRTIFQDTIVFTNNVFTVDALDAYAWKYGVHEKYFKMYVAKEFTDENSKRIFKVRDVTKHDDLMYRISAEVLNDFDTIRWSSDEYKREREED